MNSEQARTHHKGGRPKKAVCKDQQLAVMCNQVERKVIEAKAKAVNVSVSEFLRTLALKGQIDSRKKWIPKEVLLFTATLNHLAANMNQVAKKRNRGEDFNAMERAELHVLSGKIKQLAQDIKNYLQ